MNVSWELLRRAGIIIAGLSLFIVGAFMLVFPGPGVLVMAAGLALLAREFDWAYRLLRFCEDQWWLLRRWAERRGLGTAPPSPSHKFSDTSRRVTHVREHHAAATPPKTGSDDADPQSHR